MEQEEQLTLLEMLKISTQMKLICTKKKDTIKLIINEEIYLHVEKMQIKRISFTNTGNIMAN